MPHAFQLPALMVAQAGVRGEGTDEPVGFEEAVRAAIRIGG